MLLKQIRKNSDVLEILIGAEFVFLVNLIRNATKINIAPKSVTTKNAIKKSVRTV